MANLNDYTPNELHWMSKGVRPVKENLPEYNFIASSSTIHGYKKPEASAAVLQARAIVQQSMSNGSLKLSAPGIMRGVSGASFYNTHPQYVLEQFVGPNAIQDGMTVFGFDIESLGGFGPKSTSGIFAPTEIAIDAMTFNKKNPSYNIINGRKVYNYFESKGSTLNIVRRLDSNEVTYVNGLIKKLGDVKSINSITGISIDDQRTLRDLMRYAGDAVFENNGVVSQNSRLRNQALLTAAHVPAIREGLKNLQKNGLSTDDFIARINGFVGANTLPGSQFKTMAYNGLVFDGPAMISRFGGSVDLFGKNSSGMIDNYATITSLYSNPLQRFYGSGVKSGATDLTLENLSSVLFGVDTSKSHQGLVDVGNMRMLANYMMADIDTVYMSGDNSRRAHKSMMRQMPMTKHRVPSKVDSATGKVIEKTNIRMATYDSKYLQNGDRLYARKGLTASEDSVFDMVFRMNKSTNQPELLENYSNSILSARTYQIQGTFNFTSNGKEMWGMQLYNEDEDFLHMIIRDDPRKLQDLVHENFSYIGKDGHLALETRELARTYKDAARREYERLFTPSMDQYGGRSFDLLKDYIGAHDKVQAALGKELDERLISGGKYGFIQNRGVEQVANITGLTETQARNYLYMRDRFSSELETLVRPFANRLEAEGITGANADLALWNFKQAIDTTAGRHTTAIMPKFGNEQMFILNPVKNEYKLANIGNVSQLMRSLSGTITQGGNPGRYKMNAQAILTDLLGRGYITQTQHKILKGVIGQMDATELGGIKPTQFMQDLADNILRNSGENNEKLITRVVKEFGIASALGRAEEVAAGNAPDAYFIDAIKGGVAANYEQESLRARKINKKAVRHLTSNEVMGGAIDKANQTIAVSRKNFSEPILKFDADTHSYFQQYDDYMRKRLKSISTGDINLARGYKDLSVNLSELAAAFTSKDPDKMTAASVFMDKDKQSLVMVLHNEKDAAEVMKQGALYMKNPNAVGLEIPLADMKNNTFRRGRQSLMNITFLETEYGTVKPGWGDVYGEGVTERTIRHYRMGSGQIINAMKEDNKEAIKNANRIAKRYADKAVAEVSGSGKVLDSLLEDSLHATNNGAIVTRGGNVSITGLTGLYSSLRGKEFDDLNESEKVDFFRYLSKSMQDNEISLTYQGVKGAGALRGMVSSFNSRLLSPLAAYGAATRENYQQLQSYYDLAKYDIYNSGEQWRFGGSTLMTNTEFEVHKGELTGIAAKVSYMTDDKVMAAAVKAGIQDPGTLSVSEGMILVADDMKRYMNVKETKLISVPNGMNLSDEMKELLAQANNKNVEVYLPDWEPGNKFTIAKAATEEIKRSGASPIEYGDKHRARVVGSRLDEKSGELIVELEQHLDSEDGMKLFIGTDKGTVRFVERSTIEAIGGKGTDILAGAEWGKRQDFNNPIVGTINRIIDEARGNGKSNAQITKAFSDQMGLDIQFKKQKLTIGKATVNRYIPTIPDLVNPKEDGPDRILLSQAIKAGNALDVNFDKNIFQAVQEIRLARVSRFAQPFGYDISEDEGVKYGLRELEVLRNKKILINGKEYGTSKDTYKWFMDTIDSRAKKKFNGGYKGFLLGIDKSMKSFDGTSIMEDGDLIIGTNELNPIKPENLKEVQVKTFGKIKSIEGIDGMTREDLKGTILDPKMKGKNSQGFWFETPFDWTIEGQDRPKNKLFLLQDDVKGYDGNLYPTELQKHELAIERASREFIQVRDGIKTHPNKEQQELLDDAVRRGQRAVNDYIKQLGKDATGSHGRVSQDMFSGKIGNSGQFTIAGRNVFDNGSAFDMAGKAASANTSYISEEYARGMFKGLDLSNEQISDIIEVMKNGEGVFTTTNRYPTFDEGSIIVGRTKISDKLHGDVSAISVGDAMRMKADYDGDHLYKVVAFANKFKGTDLTYSALAQQAQENYNQIVAGKMALKDIENPLIREFTEIHMMSESDAQKSATLGKFWQANYLVDATGKTKMPGIQELSDSIDKDIEEATKDPKYRGQYKDFGVRLTTSDLAASEEFMTREGRIMKQVGSASNLNARMRRFTEALVDPDVMKTIGKDMTDAAVGTALFNSILPEQTWAKISTAASIFEQTGIGAKHIITLMDKLGIDPKTMSDKQKDELFGTLNKFKTGLENFDGKSLREANEKFKAMGWKDQLRLGSGEITSASIEEIFGAAAIDVDMDKDQLDAFLKSFKFLGSGEEESTEKLIQAVERVGQFMDKYEFRKNPFLKFSLSSSSDPESAINSWKELSNYKSRYFVPTAEVERFYSAAGKQDEFEEGKKLFAARMSMRNKDISGKYFSMDGDNFTSIVDEARSVRTIGDDTIEHVGSKLFSGLDGGKMANGVVGGVATFGALWAASALFRNGPEEDSVELPQADQAPSSDGKYVDPAVFGVAPRGSAPTARVSPRGGGYENINITINADDAHGWSESQIRDIVQEQLSNQMPMNVNMNVSSRDNTQKIDKQWVNDTVTRAIKFGWAW